MASLNAVLVDQGQLCLLNQARQLSADMLESLLHDLLLCMKHSMQVLRLSHLLDDRKPLSFQNKFSQCNTAVSRVLTFFCLVRSNVICMPPVNVNSGVCAPAYLAAIKAARFCKQTDSNGASTFISYTCLRTLLP